MFVGLLRRLYAPRVYRWLLNGMFLLVGLSLAGSGYQIAQNDNAVTEACKIQQRGLVADRHLVAFLGDWDRLIMLQRAQTQKMLVKEPKGQRIVTIAALRELDLFVAVQEHQPQDRSCP